MLQEMLVPLLMHKGVLFSKDMGNAAHFAKSSAETVDAALFHSIFL